MHIYRFKFTFEEQDDFLREFDVRSDQTFEEFHNAITENLGLDKGMLSSFFITDARFRKKREISLIDMSPEELPERDEEEQQEEKMLVMKDAVVSDFIDDPHQKLLYIYDYLNYWTFYLEMLKIAPANPNESYPRVFKSLGEVPRELTAKAHQILGDDPSFDLGFDEDQYDPEDLKSLEDDEFLDEERGGSFDDFGEDKF
ncbi:MAG: plasmid pRiA4b ORF-3 family protein [Bacteroidales bacterium]|nr:plasmid pRiA4b ORF-3 family protein [Bacteroidales bacterium]